MDFNKQFAIKSIKPGGALQCSHFDSISDCHWREGRRRRSLATFDSSAQDQTAPSFDVLVLKYLGTLSFHTQLHTTHPRNIHSRGWWSTVVGSCSFRITHSRRVRRTRRYNISSRTIYLEKHIFLTDWVKTLLLLRLMSHGVVSRKRTA